MTPTDNLEAGAGDLVAQKLRERAVFMREAGHDDDADLDLDAAAQLAAVTAENARLREGWHDIESAPEGMQILVWETDYGWLLACKDRHHTTGWAGKSSGNFYWTMPQSVVDKLTHWRPLGDSPASQEAPK